MNNYIACLFLEAILIPGISSNGQLVSVSTSSENVFTATRNGKNIGWLKASHYQSGNDTWITTESNLLIDILITFSAKAKCINKYVGTVLTEAEVHRTLNGRSKLDNIIRMVNGSYHFSGTEATPVTKVIRNSVTFLYFNEPVNVREVFSEVYFTYLPVIKVSESTYLTRLPDGGTMTYTYRLGRLMTVVAKTTYGTVTFSLVP